jgi:hypothetical protein
MTSFMKLTARQTLEGESADLWVNLDLAVSMRRSGDRTLIDFTAPRVSFGQSPAGFDVAPRRIEVVETPEEILGGGAGSG